LINYDGPGLVRVEYSFSIEDSELVERALLRDSVRPGEIVNETFGEKIWNGTLFIEGEARISFYMHTIYTASDDYFDFVITIPEAPHITLIAPTTSSLGVFWDVPSLNITVSIAANQAVSIESSFGHGSWHTVMENVSTDHPVTFPISLFENPNYYSVTRGFRIRASDGVYRSRSFEFSYFIYPRGPPVLQNLGGSQFPVPGDRGCTFEVALSDENSQSLELLYRNPELSNAQWELLLSGVAPAASILFTIPAWFVANRTEGDPFELAASDGTNTTDSLRMYLPYYWPGFFFAVDPPVWYIGLWNISQPPSLSLKIGGVRIGQSVNIRFALDTEDGEDVSMGSLTHVVQSSVETVPIPAYILGQVPTSPGGFFIEMTARAANERDAFAEIHGFISAGHDITLQLTQPGSTNLGSLSAITTPTVSLYFTASGYDGPYHIVVITTEDDDSDTDDSTNPVTVVNISTFWRSCARTPGEHRLEFYAWAEDSHQTSNPIICTYTILDDGVFTISSSVSEPLHFNASIATVVIPLVIGISGNRGAGSLKLEYSTATPPEWETYSGVVAIGKADYSFERRWSTANGTLHLRISRFGVGGNGTFDIPYLDSHPPTRPATSTPSSSPLPTASPRPTPTPLPVPISSNETVYLASSDEEPIVLSGTGTIAPESGSTLRRGVVVLNASADVQAIGLTVVTRVFLAGSSSLRAVESDLITLVNDSVDIELSADGTDQLPILSLGNIGDNYQVIPRSLKVTAPTGLSGDALKGFSHPLISGSTLTNCESWQEILEMESADFRTVCEDGSGATLLSNGERSLVVKGVWVADPTTDSDSGPNVPLIVGVVVGSVAAVAIVGAIIAVVVRNRQQVAAEPSGGETSPPSPKP
jgi:hypothetical protein